MLHGTDRSKSYLTSPIFSVVVDKENAKTFLLHSALLVDESDRLAKDVKGGFSEGASKRIVLEEEDSELFGYFVEYLYRSESIMSTVENVKRESDYIILARLYALAERLQAHKFQHAILRKFTSNFSSSTTIPDQGVCDLLDIVCTELPDKIEEDPLRVQVFWFAAYNLTQLQKYDYFLRLLGTHQDLGRYLCKRAGGGTSSQPRKPSEPLPVRFKPESIYQS